MLLYHEDFLTDSIVKPMAACRSECRPTTPDCYYLLSYVAEEEGQEVHQRLRSMKDVMLRIISWFSLVLFINIQIILSFTVQSIVLVSRFTGTKNLLQIQLIHPTLEHEPYVFNTFSKSNPCSVGCGLLLRFSMGHIALDFWLFCCPLKSHPTFTSRLAISEYSRFRRFWLTIQLYLIEQNLAKGRRSNLTIYSNNL